MKRSGKVVSLIAVALFGVGIKVLVADGALIGTEQICGGKRLLKKGKLILHRGDDPPELNLEGRAVLEQSAAGCFGMFCRNAEAGAMLGLFQCMLGDNENWKAGRRRIVEAMKLDPSVSPEFILLCKPPTKSTSN